MSTVPARETPPPEPAESVEEKFRRLAAVWTAETAYVSSSGDLVAHPAFQEIVGMGRAVIPLLLRELEKGSGHWHRALRRITGADPVPPADRGDIDKAAEAWLRLAAAGRWHQANTIHDGLASSGRTFGDSADLVRESRDGQTPREVVG
jgi:hypothetical protein